MRSFMPLLAAGVLGLYMMLSPLPAPESSNSFSAGSATFSKGRSGDPLLLLPPTATGDTAWCLGGDAACGIGSPACPTSDRWLSRLAAPTTGLLLRSAPRLPSALLENMLRSLGADGSGLCRPYCMLLLDPPAPPPWPLPPLAPALPPLALMLPPLLKLPAAPPETGEAARSLCRPPARAMWAVGVAGKLAGSCGAPGTDRLSLGGSFLAGAWLLLGAGPAEAAAAAGSEPAKAEPVKLVVRVPNLGAVPEGWLLPGMAVGIRGRGCSRTSLEGRWLSTITRCMLNCTLFDKRNQREWGPGTWYSTCRALVTKSTSPAIAVLLPSAAFKTRLADLRLWAMSLADETTEQQNGDECVRCGKTDTALDIISPRVRQQLRCIGAVVGVLDQGCAHKVGPLGRPVEGHSRRLACWWVPASRTSQYKQSSTKAL